jgi:hypothetical protein
MNSQQFLIFQEPKYVFKKFSMLRYISPEQKLLLDKPESQVYTVLGETGTQLQDIAAWVQKSFVLND